MTDGPWSDWPSREVIGDVHVSSDRILEVACNGCHRLVPYEQTGRHVHYVHGCVDPQIQFRMLSLEGMET